MYLLGIDGCESKTHCIIGDENGNIYAEAFGGAANYNFVEKNVVKQSIQTAISRALNKLNLQITDISYAVLGLAGADYKEDIDHLEKICKKIFVDVPFEIVNDCCIGLRAGSEEGWGVVTICGLGHKSMGKDKNGMKVELPNINYSLGSKVRGREWIREVLYWAFRVDEEGGSSKLQYELPKLLGVNKMSEVDKLIREQGLDIEGMKQIPSLVTRLAKEEDTPCQEMIIAIGSMLGKNAAGIIRRLEAKQENIPVILLGSMFTSENPLLMDAYKMEVHKVAYKAEFKVLDKKPVRGAYYLAMDFINENKKIKNIKGAY